MGVDDSLFPVPLGRGIQGPHKVGVCDDFSCYPISHILLYKMGIYLQKTIENDKIIIFKIFIRVAWLGAD